MSSLSVPPAATPPEAAAHARRFNGADVLPDDQASRLRVLMDALAAPAAPRVHAATIEVPRAAFNGLVQSAQLRADSPREHPALYAAPRPSAATAPAPAAASPTPAAPASARRTCPIIAIASGKGGVGKTTLSVNLAVAFSELRLRATLLDADLGLANADVMCGLSPTTRLDSAIDLGRGEYLTDPRTARAKRALPQIAVPAPGGFRLVPGAVGIARMANLTAPQREVILRGLADLESDSDLLLIDTGAGLSEGVTSFIAAADLAVVVATPEPTSIADAYALIKCTAHARRRRDGSLPPGLPPIALIVNQANSPEEGHAVHQRISATCARFLGFEPLLLGVIRADATVPAAVRTRTPLLLHAPRAEAAHDVRSVAGALVSNLRLTLPPAPPRKGLLRRIFGR